MADLMAMRAAVLGSIAVVAKKSFDRDLLTDGDSHDVEAKITGTVDGRKFSFNVDTTLTVGHENERTKKDAPSAEAMLAFVLQTVEAKYGAKAIGHIASSLLAEYNKTKTIEADEKWTEAVDDWTTVMTVESKSKVRGDVNVIAATKTVEMKISNSKLA